MEIDIKLTENTYYGLKYYYRYISSLEAEICYIYREGMPSSKIIFPDIIDNHVVTSLDYNIFFYEPICRYLKYITLIKFPLYMKEYDNSLIYEDSFEMLNKIIYNHNLILHKNNDIWIIL